MNWKVFCVVGILWSAFWAALAYSKGHMGSAEFQTVVGLLYGAGLTYHLLKAKKDV